MEKFKSLTLEQKIDQLKEDYQNEWWKPSKIDDYDLKKKVILKENLIIINYFFQFNFNNYQTIKIN